LRRSTGAGYFPEPRLVTGERRKRLPHSGITEHRVVPIQTAEELREAPLPTSLRRTFQVGRDLRIGQRPPADELLPDTRQVAVHQLPERGLLGFRTPFHVVEQLPQHPREGLLSLRDDLLVVRHLMTSLTESGYRSRSV
jgi:hypothetical protein